ncbi:MAG TPA: alanine dehydrogenase [Bacteroidia bacterium]|jgi:alanine dehydrogenase|nr:alanine dehydrogenase [Bacteroidia bacterium]
MVISKEALYSLTKGVMMPQEEMLEVARKKGKLFIGIPNEIAYQENRVPLVPDAVALLINNGHKVVIETNAGKAANFLDNDYSEAGAEIAYSAEEVYKADIVVKIAPPTTEEVELMQQKQTLFSALQFTTQPEEFLKKLSNKKINAVAVDWITDEQGILPFVRAMGEIAGGASILIAAEYLSNNNNGMGSILGGISGISPTEVVILGAGTVSEFAARAAIGLGAYVKVFDNSTTRLRRMQSNLGSRVFTSIIQPKVLAKHLKTADVVIGAVRSKTGRAPIIISEAMVSEMKVGSVIVDVSIDQGGCCETSEVTNHSKPVFRKHGVIHYCVPNIASRVSRTASYAFSNLFAQILLTLGDEGGFESLVRKDSGVRNGVYLYNGVLTNQYLAETFNMPFKDINLLVAMY